MTMALLSSSSSSTPTHLPSFSASSTKPHLAHKPCLLLSLSPSKPRKTHLSISPIFRATAGKEAGVAISSSATVAAENEEENGEIVVMKKKFQDPRWVNGTWDLKQFQKDGKTDWDAVIDAEAKRRKWLENYPETTSNDGPVVFDTSIIPWWAWIQRFHLPEAELLNGRAAMIGFFMAYFVDSLTGFGVVDQTNNLVCKTLLFVAALGVLLFRKNEDVENLKKLLEETTFYDKQWQATWQEETDTTTKKD